MSYPQYGVYLIPPPHLMHALGLAHELLASQFNTRIAGRFMSHCTVKGFFKLAEGLSPADFIPALDKLFGRFSAFPTEIVAIHPLNQGAKGISILSEVQNSEVFRHFQAEIWDNLRPVIAPDCLFTPGDGFGPGFWPHFTLAQADAPHDPGLLAQAVGLCQYIFERSLKGPFLAQDMQLIEFYSDDWAGSWGDSLSYRQLKGWRLPDPS